MTKRCDAIRAEVAFTSLLTCWRILPPMSGQDSSGVHAIIPPASPNHPTGLPAATHPPPIPPPLPHGSPSQTA